MLIGALLNLRAAAARAVQSLALCSGSDKPQTRNFYYMIKDGWLRRMAEQLTVAQFDRLIAELKKMMCTTKD